MSMKSVIGLMMVPGLCASQSGSAASLSKSDVKYVTDADPELKQFAGKELETVSRHKQTIDMLQAQIK